MGSRETTLRSVKGRDLRSPSRWLVAGACATCIATAGGSAFAAQRDWVDATGGSFHDANNWSPKLVPGASDVAMFKLGVTSAARYTVSNVKGDASRFVVANDALTFDFNGVNLFELLGTSRTEPGLVVGAGGPGASGDLRLTHGGVLKARHAAIAQDAGTSGGVTVDGATQWRMADDLMVGRRGTGTLLIQGGAEVFDAVGSIGDEHAAVGAVTVTGSGARWINASDLFVGKFGDGTLTIRDGASVDNFDAAIANGAGSTGAVTVTGEHSTWTSSQLLMVGDSGDGTLAIERGATVFNGTFGAIGNTAGATGSVTIRDPGSSWITSIVVIGMAGTGTLSLASGAELDSRGMGVIANAPGSSGTANLDGLGTRWQPETLIVGYHGAATMNVTGGAHVGSTFGSIAYGSASEATALVTGAGSRWDNADYLDIGSAGRGTLDVADGGVVNTSIAALGRLVGASGTVNVIGRGSALVSASDVGVGVAGSGVLNVLDGGTVSAQRDAIVAGDESAVGVVTIDGAGSTLHAGGALFVGRSGDGQVTISNGGTLIDTQGFVGDAMETTYTPTVTVSGPGSSWINADTLQVGGAGFATIDIRDGGRLTNGSARVGIFPNASPFALDTVRLQGSAASSWSTAGNLAIGAGGIGLLEVRAGHATVGEVMTLGDSAASIGHLSLHSAEARVDVESDLIVGRLGIGRAWVLGGGELHSGGSARLGEEAGASGELYLYSGGRWSGASDVDIGYGGTGSVELRYGGFAQAANTILGHQAGSRGSLDIVDVGSRWSTGEMQVGFFGSATLRVLAGGTLTSTAGSLGTFAGGTGRGEVSGSGSAWNAGTLLRVGAAGTGALDVLAGATVSARAALVGFGASATASIRVDGTGSTLEVSGPLHLGTFGSARMDITRGGVVTVGSLAGGNAASGIVFDDGTLRLTASDTASNAFTLHGEGGTLEVDEPALFVLTSNVGGTGGLTKTGRGILTLTGASDYAGPTDVRAGVLSLYGYGGSPTLLAGGRVTVDGTGGELPLARLSGERAKWQHAGDLFVGDVGTGRLEILEGAEMVSGFNALVGTEAGSSGSVLVSGGDFRTGKTAAWTNAADIAIGLRGTGSIRVEAGADVVGHHNSIVGHQVGGVGSVEIDGPGATWTTQEMHVGFEGRGDLVVRNGGTLTSTRGFLGVFGGGVGTAEVSGVGSTWAGEDDLHVGLFGRGDLNVLAGGRVTTQYAIGVGRFAGASGTVRVQGGGSALIAGTGINVGFAGNGELDVASGGTAVASTDMHVGVEPGSTGYVTVAGAGARIDVAGTMVVGHQGTGGFEVRAGGTLRVGNTLLLGEHGEASLAGGVIDVATLANSGGRFTFASGTLHADTVLGRLVNGGGTLAPGHSPGMTTIVGDYIQRAAGALEIELADYAAFDVVEIRNGSALIDGVLDVERLDGFDPVIGTVFDFLRAEGGIQGGFANVYSPVWNGKRFVLDTSDVHAWRLQVAAVPLPSSAWMLGGVMLVFARCLRRRPAAS